MAEALRPYAPRLFVSSPEPKARETAALVAGALGVPCELDQDLREHGRSSVSQLPQERFRAAIADLFAHSEELVFGDETGVAAEQRFTQAVERVCSLHKDGTVVLVSHGTVISLYVARISDCDAFTFWKELGLPAFVVITLAGLTVDRVDNTLRPPGLEL